MSRHWGVRALVAAGLLAVVGVLGVAAKVGRDASEYLQTVSQQRNWNAPGQAAAVPSGEVAALGGGGADEEAIGTPEVVASR